MKLAIMQPHLFPTIGYFQLVGAVDRFVFLDDVNLSKSGWTNRILLRLNGQVRYVSIPLAGKSQSTKINAAMTARNEAWKRRTAESIRHAYGKAPNYACISELLAEILYSDEPYVTRVAEQSVKAVAQYIGLKTEFVRASMAYDNTHLRGSARVIDICRRDRVRQYFASQCTASQYDVNAFRECDTEILFTPPVQPERPRCRQCVGDQLSIIDIMMFADRDSLRTMLDGREGQ
ncbi:WbqC family protein [Noviherbaspirillum sp. ST9]|uniref:WbqC family protein n=1 Tax=Noviherbaspirillum sp. ST9 TaxID=3401606 RepID=UPI003B58B227